ncbi:receptor-like protein EIX1 [Ziziphus jujuba]|uniref:Receptor-like protein EIX1 n=1 Tax=Ziziphus jujuba TaxID=326968 RepID=A0ABM3I8G2_ZIZJJ|nr:receptor-like protein EIX1 [Ziziphus jujuba]
MNMMMSSVHFNLIIILQFLPFSFLALSHLDTTAKLCSTVDDRLPITCKGTEREALLDFKKGLTDPSSRLSSWGGTDCCKWYGIECSDQTGHVTKIDLRNPYKFFNGGEFDSEAYKRSCLGGKIEVSLARLQNLSDLDLSLNDFEGIQIPNFFGEIKSLRYLNLSFASFSGEIPPHLGNLSSLEYLDLYADSFSTTGTWDLQSENLQWLSGLFSLKSLNLGFVKLDKVGANWLPQVNLLSSLVELKLRFCGLQGLPQSFPILNFTSLSVLDLSDNSFGSPMPLWLFNLTSLTKLHLVWNFFNGPIPSEVTNLNSLEVLDLAANLYLEGQIPRFLGNLSKLQILDLSGNNFSGKIHDFLDRFKAFPKSSLVSIDLSSNSLEGFLPESLGNLRSLQHLILSGNSFWGSIPASVRTLSEMRVLDLSYNEMNGTIPKGIGKLSNLVNLDLKSNSWVGVVTESHLMNLTNLENLWLTTEPTKSLVFDVPYQWVPPFSLIAIRLQNCRVGPKFPRWLQAQSELSTVSLVSAGISDTIPESWFTRLSSQLVLLDLSKNQIKGKLPQEFVCPKLNAIDLSSNHFDGPVPLFSTNASQIFLHDNLFSGSIPENFGQQMPRLEKLYLSWNHLSGGIPSSLCDIASLQVLALRNNHLTGELPNCWFHSLTLWAVDVTNNSLSGPIPTSMGFLPSLTILMLGNNKFSGEIPSSLQNCSGLTSIDLCKNRFTGNLPSWIGRREASLFMLKIHSNKFGGHVPEELCNLLNLRILDLSDNEFSGVIPNCLQNLTAFVNVNISSQAFVGQIWSVLKGREPDYSSIIANANSINLSGNNLTGKLPSEMTSLSALQSLNLSRNYISGSIPKEIANLEYLQTLDLSHNHLSGQIPQSLSSVTSLTKLNLSYNDLQGRIPPLPKFQDASIFEGNPSLCGDPLPTKCKEN